MCKGGTEPAFELGASSHPWAEAQDKRSILSILGAPLLFLLRTKSFSISQARELGLCKLVMHVLKGRHSRKTPLPFALANYIITPNHMVKIFSFFVGLNDTSSIDSLAVKHK